MEIMQKKHCKNYTEKTSVGIWIFEREIRDKFLISI